MINTPTNRVSTEILPWAYHTGILVPILLVERTSDRRSIGSTSDGRPTDVQRTSDGRPTDARQTSHGRSTNVRRTSDRRPLDVQWTFDERPTDVRRMSDARPGPLDVRRTSNRQMSDGRPTGVGVDHWWIRLTCRWDPQYILYCPVRCWCDLPPTSCHDCERRKQ